MSIKRSGHPRGASKSLHTGRVSRVQRACRHKRTQTGLQRYTDYAAQLGYEACGLHDAHWGLGVMTL
jgi:hypothetical protein